MWDLPGPGLEPTSPSLAGGFLTTAPPGKPTKFFFTWSIKSIIWDRYDYTHSTQEKTEAQKIKVWGHSQDHIAKTSQGHNPTQSPNFKPRALFIIKWYQFLTSELLLLCHCTVPGSMLGTKNICWMDLTFAFRQVNKATPTYGLRLYWFNIIFLYWEIKMQLYLKRDWGEKFQQMEQDHY